MTDLRAAGPEQSVVWTVPAFRARSAQERVKDLQDQLAGELEKRNRALREASDGGAPPKQLAAMVGISRSNLYAVLGTAPV